jgi:hypothetical protein
MPIASPGRFRESGHRIARCVTAEDQRLLAVPDLGRSSELMARKLAPTYTFPNVDRQSASNFMSMRPVSISAPSKNQVIVVVTVMTGHNGHNLNREISWLVI